MTSQASGNVPAELTSFVGRRQELATAKRLMSGARLLTLTGPGGVGKTRLARRLAQETHRAFRDGVWLVELAALQQGDFIAQSIADVLGLRDDSTDPLDQLTGYLRDKRLLLVIDNCEHLINSCAAVTAQLLAAAPELQVVTTSRQALAVEGEQVFPVPPLSLPAPVEERDNSVTGTDAITLFAERGRAVNPDFEVNDTNRPTITEICRRLEGIPLALELAAVRLRALSEDQILARLDDALELLKLGPRTMPARQQTIEATIEWSYRLCAPAERHLWQLLSVFGGGFTLDAVEEICPDESYPAEAVFDAFYGLVDKSIIVREGKSLTSSPRYHLPEVLRQFGMSRLIESGMEESARSRHRDYYSRIATRGDTDYCSPRDVDWFEQVRAEHANLRNALEYSLSQPPETRIALRMATQLRPFWTHAGFPLEGYRWLTRALAADVEPSPDRTRALWSCVFLAAMLGEAKAGQRMLDECRDIAGAHPDPELQVANLLHTAILAFYHGEFSRALIHAEAAAKLSDNIDNLGLVGECHACISIFSFSLDDPKARTFARTFLNITEEQGANMLKALALWMVGLGYWRNQDYRRAEDHIAQAIKIFHRFDHQVFLGTCFEGIAWCAVSTGDLERATKLLGAADAIWRTSRFRIAQVITRVVGDEIARQVRKALGDRAWKAAHEFGARLSLQEAIDLALRKKPRTATVRRPSAGSAATPLTRREQEIAKLVGRGLTNKEIAARLVISVRTAETHVENIFTKLGLNSRGQVAAWINEREREREPRTG